MYIVAILLMSAMAMLIGPISAIESIRDGRIALGVLHIVITLLFLALAVIIFVIRDRRSNFELDYCDDDDPRTMDLKNAGGCVFAIAIILLIAIWFCRLGNII